MKEETQRTWHSGITLFVLLCVLAVQSAFSLPTSGVYRIVNAAYNKVIAEDYLNKKLICSAPGSSNDYEQLWELTVSGSSYTLRNVYTGNYVQNMTSFYNAFSTAAASASFYISENSSNSGYYNITNSSSASTGMHCDASSNVVLWYIATASGTSASEWTFQSVSLTSAQITAARAEYAELITSQANAATYYTTLQTIFSDAACTTLNSTYAAMSDTQLRSAMSTLPTALQNMAVKIKNNAWGTYEQEFRVRSYKPYSDANNWGTRLNTFKYSYMNNPTGIYACSREILYVIVGGDIPANATLYIEGVADANVIGSATAGVALTKGLNVVPVAKDSAMQYILYTADTYNTTKTIADFSNLNIHIEGGTVNGFWEEGVHDNARWVAYKTFSTHPMMVVKGKRILFDMQKSYMMASDCCPSTITDAIALWDSIASWEQHLSGFCDDGAGVSDDYYPSHFNNLLCARSLTNGYQSAGSYSTQYAASYIHNLLPYANVMSAGDNAWGPAHENGHVHQEPINMVGCSEVSNNLFSNLVISNLGKYMSRGGTIAQCASEFNDSIPWLKRSGESKMRMYWQLYLYYHMAGNNTAFYPTLFKLLRNDPLVKATQTNGAECSMKFVEKCCQAAGEDLTDFFTAWGFFIPLNNVYCDDYASYYVTLTQSQIDATKTTISAYTKKNHSIQFIEDRVASIARTDGVSGSKVANGVAVGAAGSLGQYTDFVSGSTSQASGYVYTQAGTTLTMSGGTGGVGFAVYNATGNLVAFANKTSVELPAWVAASTFTVRAANGDGTQINVISAMQGTTAQQLAALNVNITAANVYLNLKDTTGTKVGWYKSSSLAALTSLVATANSAISNGQSASYGTLAGNINTELVRLATATNVKVALSSSNYYSLVNVLYPSYSAALSGTNLTNTTAATTADAKKWAFEPASTSGQYYIKSKSGYYVTTVATSTTVTATATSTSGALAFKVVDNGDGTFYLMNAAASSYGCLHCDAGHNMVGWSSDATASHWKITMTEGTVESDTKYTLGNLITATNSLVNSVCTYAAAGAVTLQTTSSTAAGYLSTNAQESSEGPIANLIDGSTSTFFHSTWSAATSAYHYLQVDLGSGVSLGSFAFAYTTRAGNYLNKPTTMLLSGSNDGSTFTQFATLTSSDSNPLPSNTTSQQSYTSSQISCGAAYRYLRFTVTATNNGATNSGSTSYPFFSMAEFSLTHPASIVVNSDKPSVTEALVSTAVTQKSAAQTIYDNSSSTESDYSSALSSLQTAYDALLAASLVTPVVDDHSQLDSVIAVASTYFALEDSTTTKVGYYTPAALATLHTLVNSAHAAIAAVETTSYATLLQQIESNLSSVASSGEKVALLEGSFYSLVNKAYPTYSAALNGTTVTNTTASTATDAHKWTFVSTATAGRYYIKNKLGYYITSVVTSSSVTATSLSRNEALTFDVVSLGSGLYYIKDVAGDSYCCLHCDGSHNMVGWESGSTASQWYLTLTETGSAVSASKESLGILITNTGTLINNVCTVSQSTNTAVTLQTTSSTAAGYLSTNAQESSEGAIANLIDGSTSTFFHSTWSAATSAYHYLQVDLGSGVSLGSFTFAYTTRAGNYLNKPTTMLLSGSNDGSTFTQFATLTSSDSNPLPSNTTSQQSYTSSQISCGAAYRYLRFTVTATNNGATNSGSTSYPFFSMAEFSLTKIGPVITINASMPSVTEALVTTAINQKAAAQTVYEAPSSTESGYTASLSSLQSAYDALLAASLDTVVVVTPIDSTAYKALRSAIATATALTDINAGSNPGYYPQSQVTAYTTALASAQSVLAASGSTTNDYTAATTTLNNAVSALTLNMPQAGVSYVLESANVAGSYCAGSYMYVYGTSSTGGLRWKVYTSTVDAAGTWTFDVSGSNYYLKNSRTGTYVNTATSNTQVKLASKNNPVTLTYVGGGQFTIAASGYKLYARQTSKYIIASTGSKDSPAAWYIKAVSSLGAPEFRGFDDGVNTDVQEVETEAPEEAVIYDLMGRRILKVEHSGLYIVNGKKMFIK